MYQEQPKQNEVKKNPDEIGALWRKQGRKGEFLTGEINIDGVAHRFIAFPNQTFDKPNRPAYRILKAKSPEERQKEREYNDALGEI